MKLLPLATLLAIWPLAASVAAAAAKDDDDGDKAADGPKFASQKFELPPRNLFFFDDSETALALVSDGERMGRVYRTTAAGEAWDVVKDFPEGDPYVIYRHPADNKVAVTLGRARTHWVTYDQGKTWKEFKTKEHPSSGTPIRFHGEDSKRFLYQGEERCEFFSDSCLGSVSLGSGTSVMGLYADQAIVRRGTRPTASIHSTNSSTTGKTACGRSRRPSSRLGPRHTT